ncbi:hypothetical protein BJ138DRAFT_1175551 [Hygrophoropsis aurantiaca]|uniref:Uncharacterized protein n=1 Tax=Hygrophoropsis aurantiaca TaxID=72124 RepID=A0ACB8AV06_9AGAM|nr:hypothetical protein BJ138DRAFT_1175551 [Hygrophoropsis aurantiaca]
MKFSTFTHSPTQVPALGSASASKENGGLGVSFRDGTMMIVTSGGQKALVSNSSFEPSLPPALRIFRSEFLAITEASSRVGGRDAVVTNPSTPPSSAFMPLPPMQTAQSLLATSQAKPIQQTTRLEAFIPPFSSFYPPLKSPPISATSSSTSITPFHLPNSLPSRKRNRFMELESIPTSTASPTPSLNSNTSAVAKSSSKRRKITYPADLTPVSSSLRPHCLAKDRLRLWKPVSAFSLSSNAASGSASSTPLVESDLQRIQDVMIHAWAESTRESYGSGLLVFHIFCDSKAIPENQRAPASSTLISSFISCMAGSYSGKTVSNYLNGVRAWHILHGIQWALNDKEIEALLKAAESLTPPASKRKKRLPYTVDIIVAIRNQLDLGKPLDAAVYACLMTTFYATGRVGEFTVPRIDGFDGTIHIKPSNVRNERDRNGLETTAFHLPRTKSAGLQGEDVFWARQNGPSDPEAAYLNHLHINAPPADGHLFAYKHNKDVHRPLTKHKFLARLNQATKAANIDPLQGHGIRIGSTLEYLLRGIPFDVMKVKGRWASDAFLLYLRKHAQIMAPYMQATPELHEGFVRYTMPPIR